MAMAAKRDMEERKVVVSRKELIEALESNLKSHVATYKAAVAGYADMAMARLEEAVIKARENLDKNFKRAKAEIEGFDEFGDDKKHRQYFELVRAETLDLPVPQNYSDAYEAAIAMAEWDTRETLELTFAEFNCFVRDKWDWKEDFVTVNSMYLGRQ